MERPKLGEWCTVTAKLWRGRRWERGSFTYKYWSRHPFPKPVRAMFIGYRTGANGLAEWIDEEVGNVFNPKEYVHMWMFVTDERSKPFFVFPDDVLNGEVTPLPDGDPESDLSDDFDFYHPVGATRVE